ncbi:hypothetical protein LCGC14_1434930, partial [marine sediment metagenome]
MAIFTISHVEKKRVCFDALDNKDVSNAVVYDIITAQDLPVDREKFAALAKSQLGVDNRAAVHKLVHLEPDQRPDVSYNFPVGHLVPVFG